MELQREMISNYLIKLTNTEEFLASTILSYCQYLNCISDKERKEGSKEVKMYTNKRGKNADKTSCIMNLITLIFFPGNMHCKLESHNILGLFGKQCWAEKLKYE